MESEALASVERDELASVGKDEFASLESDGLVTVESDELPVSNHWVWRSEAIFYRNVPFDSDQF